MFDRVSVVQERFVDWKLEHFAWFENSIKVSLLCISFLKRHLLICPGKEDLNVVVVQDSVRREERLGRVRNYPVHLGFQRREKDRRRVEDVTTGK